jgi:hypothetical protein
MEKSYQAGEGGGSKPTPFERADTLTLFLFYFVSILWWRLVSTIISDYLLAACREQLIDYRGPGKNVSYIDF